MTPTAEGRAGLRTGRSGAAALSQSSNRHQIIQSQGYPNKFERSGISTAGQGTMLHAGGGARRPRPRVDEQELDKDPTHLPIYEFDPDRPPPTLKAREGGGIMTLADCLPLKAARTTGWTVVHFDTMKTYLFQAPKQQF